MNNALQPDDRFTLLYQILHGGWKTALIEIPSNLMPKFRHPESINLKPTLPRPNENGPEIKFDPNENVKISLTFADNKLILPWITLYDARNGKRVEKLLILFEHDEFEILRVSHVLEYALEGDEGPSFEPIQIVYKWQAVGEEDLSFGVGVMFTSCLLMSIFVSGLAVINYEGMDRPSVTATRVGKHSGYDD